MVSSKFANNNNSQAIHYNVRASNNAKLSGLAKQQESVPVTESTTK